jgi:hypothetical protein
MICVAYGSIKKLIEEVRAMNCFRHGDPIKAGDQLVEIETHDGLRYAHEGCVPSCPNCGARILPAGPHRKARSSGKKDFRGLPIVEHVICPPH